MKKIVTNSQMKTLDNYTINVMEMPSLLLMERAALAAVDVLKTEKFNLSKVLIVCGTGNNGGDGLAIARLLHLSGVKADVYLAGNTEKTSEEHKIQKKIAENYGTTFVNNLKLSEYTTIVDSVFGIGLSRILTDEYQQLFHQINNATAKVLAVDIPSGIHGDNGQVMGAAVSADATVTFAYAKPGLLLYPGANYTGKVIIKDVGIYEYESSEKARIQVIQKSDMSLLPPRLKYSNKGSFGKVLLIAGSYNMSGAAYLCGKACFYTGAGMVKIHTTESNRRILQKQLPEAMLSTYQDMEGYQEYDEDGNCTKFREYAEYREYTEYQEHADYQELKKGIDWCDVIGIGPGLGTGQAAREIISFLLQSTDKPLIIDADGLNLLSKNMEQLKNYKGICIVTPHIGEMARLTGKKANEIKEDPIAAAISFAQKYQVVCVLKDVRTVIAQPDGECFINLSGNSGMATAGSGDVLTGMISGFIAQSICASKMEALTAPHYGHAASKMEALTAPHYGHSANKMESLTAPHYGHSANKMEVGAITALSVYLHGKAGDKAKKKLGERVMMASDLIKQLSRLLKEYEKEEKL